MSKKFVKIMSIVSVAVIVFAVVMRFATDFDFKKVVKGNNSNSQSVTNTPQITTIKMGDVDLSFKADGDYFYFASNNNWQKVRIKGVNVGLTEATTDLANPNVSYETYREWFDQIAEMNANTVRVFTTMPPQFYDALYDYNQSAKSPLFLIHGVWFNENYMYDYAHAFEAESEITKAFERSAKEIVDIIHGNSDYTDYGEIISANYTKDVSPYLVGYILGLEWYPDFVENTNSINAGKNFAGDYLKTNQAAAPFEAFLAEVGDYLIAYETDNYKKQAPVSFLNWQTTDTISHSNEPFTEEDQVSVNTSNIESTEKYYSGMFAAVDVYAYYPEFMNYQPEYIKPDSNGKVDTYRAYLKDLKKEYKVPVLIAEFGTPTSRGIAHKSVIDINQGGVTETEQGEAIVKMMTDIMAENYAGALIFSWQDEWFKQTWNTFKYAPDDPSTRTPNVQSAEQSYGILAMEPGKTSTCLIDGKFDDWKDTVVAQTNGGNSVSAKWDEGYLYLKVDTNKFNFNSDELLIPIQISGLGSKKSTKFNTTFAANVDFIVDIKGQKGTRVLTDTYEDLHYFTYSHQKGVYETNKSLEKKGTGIYNPIKQFMSNEIVLPLTGETFAPVSVESGLLTYGITDPQSSEFNSQADFYFKDGSVEMRIPWYLLNVMNSTIGQCLGDFYKNDDIVIANMNSVKIGVCKPKQKKVALSSIGYKTKPRSEFHTRLKKSYPIIQQALKEME